MDDSKNNLREPSLEIQKKLPGKERSLEGRQKRPKKETVPVAEIPKEDQPKDKYRIVFLILVLQGIGILLPWNLFITARSYFAQHKLSKEYTGEVSNYPTYFISYVGFASQIPNLVFNWINVFINVSGSVTPRIATAIALEVFVCVLTISLTVADTSKLLAPFFWITMASVVILNVSAGIYENTVFGMTAILPSKYSGSIILGCNLSGVLVSIISLATHSTVARVPSAAFAYFSTSLVILLLCLISYFAPPRIKFFAEHEALRNKIPVNEVMKERKIPYTAIFRSAWIQFLNIFLNYFVTLLIFPGMMAEVKRANTAFFISQQSYEIILCFFTFNVAAVFGSLLSYGIKWPHPQFLIVLVVVRLIFIPFFFFCNYQPTNIVRKAPVLFKSDTAFWVGSLLLGLSSGFIGSKAMMYASNCAEKRYRDIAGKMAAAFLVSGVFTGISSSSIFPALAEL